MNIKELEALSKALAPVIRNLVKLEVEKSSSSFSEKLKEAEKLFNESLSSVKKEFEEFKTSAEEIISSFSEIKDGKDGVDGKDYPEEKALENIKNLFDESMVGFSEKFSSLQKNVSDAISAIPEVKNGEDGKDGNDFPEDKAIAKLEELSETSFKNLEANISEFIKQSNEKVNDAISAIPEVKDGSDGKDFPEEKAIAKLEELFSEKEKDNEEKLDKFFEKIENNLQTAIESIPAPKDGKDYPEEKAVAKIEELFANIPLPKDGKSVDIEEVKKEIKEQVESFTSSIPIPKNGKDAEPVDMVEVEKLINEAVSKIPPPKNGTDGKSVSEEEVRSMVKNAVDELSKSIEPAKDGEPGKDGLQIEILPSIDQEKSYPRGCYAKHLGGLWRSFEATLGMRGWECIVNGLEDVSVNKCGDRNFEFVGRMADGSEIRKSFELPIPIYQGVFRADLEKGYQKGDTATFAGSIWHSNVSNNKSKPGTDKNWQLAVKKGRDYKEPVKKDPKDNSKGVKI